jgi:hypothetical protein
MIKPFYFIKPRSNFDLGFTPEVTAMLTYMMLFYGGAYQPYMRRMLKQSPALRGFICEGCGGVRGFANVNLRMPP